MLRLACISFNKQINSKIHTNVTNHLGKLKPRQGLVFLIRLSIILDEVREKGSGLAGDPSMCRVLLEKSPIDQRKCIIVPPLLQVVISLAPANHVTNHTQPLRPTTHILSQSFGRYLLGRTIPIWQTTIKNHSRSTMLAFLEENLTLFSLKLALLTQMSVTPNGNACRLLGSNEFELPKEKVWLLRNRGVAVCRALRHLTNMCVVRKNKGTLWVSLCLCRRRRCMLSSTTNFWFYASGSEFSCINAVKSIGGSFPNQSSL